MILRYGSKGREVIELQRLLKINDDGIFGNETRRAVIEWQRANKLKGDGIVGPLTWDAMGIASTDVTEQYYTTDNGLLINRHYLPTGEYKQGPTKKEYLFLHHTAGWHNPKNVIDEWARDNRGSVATEFVIGGQSIRGDNEKWDGSVIQAFDEGGYGWHLGATGSSYMHSHSVGIEVCNFGFLVNNKAWNNTKAHESQIVKLDKPFRGYDTWHRYSDCQLGSLKSLILHIADRDDIDVRKGLIEEVRNKGAAGFEFNPNAYNGKIKGMWSHTSVRRDKTDMFPQQELIDMLLSI